MLAKEKELESSREEGSPSDQESQELSKKRSKNIISRFFNALLALLYLIVFVLSLISFSAFANNYVRLSTMPNAPTTTCILGTLNPPTEYGTIGSCQFGIGGEVIISLYSILSIVVLVIKIIGGWTIISCFLIFELLGVILMILLAFATAVVISAGISITCHSDISTCYTRNVNGYFYFQEMQTCEATAWLAFAVLVAISIFYGIFLIMYIYGKVKAKKAKDEAYVRVTEVKKKEED